MRACGTAGLGALTSAQLCASAVILLLALIFSTGVLLQLLVSDAAMGDRCPGTSEESSAEHAVNLLPPLRPPLVTLLSPTALLGLLEGQWVQHLTTGVRCPAGMCTLR